MKLKDKFGEFREELKKDIEEMNQADNYKSPFAKDNSVAYSLYSNKLYSLIASLGGIVAIATLSGILLKSVWILLAFGLIVCFVIYKIYSLIKMYKNNDYEIIEVVCTNLKQDYLNFGVKKIYEFEPVDSNVCDNVINLSIANNETNGFFKKNHKIRVGYTYNFLFKKSPEKVYNNSNVINFERSVYDVNNNDNITEKE